MSSATQRRVRRGVFRLDRPSLPAGEDGAETWSPDLLFHLPPTCSTWVFLRSTGARAARLRLAHPSSFPRALRGHSPTARDRASRVRPLTPAARAPPGVLREAQRHAILNMIYARAMDLRSLREGGIVTPGAWRSPQLRDRRSGLRVARDDGRALVCLASRRAASSGTARCVVRAGGSQCSEPRLETRRISHCQAGERTLEAPRKIPSSRGPEGGAARCAWTLQRQFGSGRA